MENSTVTNKVSTSAKHMKKTMAAEKDKAIDEAQIRQLIDGWARALRAKDIDGVMSHYAPEILLFDLAPPLQYLGENAYRKNWVEWFATWQGPVGASRHDSRYARGPRRLVGFDDYGVSRPACRSGRCACVKGEK